VPLLVTVLAGNVVTAAVVAACLNTIDATVLRRLHPAIAVAIAAVPWADTTTTVRDITQWRAALPAAVGCTLSGTGKAYYLDAAIARLPPTLRALDVSHCWGLPAPVMHNVDFAHLRALEVLNCGSTRIVTAVVARLPPSLRELRMKRCELHAATDFSHLRALRVLKCIDSHRMLRAATIASLPPSLETLDIGCSSFQQCDWPAGGSLAHLTRLRVLSVAIAFNVDACALATFPPSLQSLNIRYCCTGTGNEATGSLTAVASMAHLHCLRTLNVSCSDIGDLATLPPSLVSLDLNYRCGAGSLTSAAVFPHLPALSNHARNADVVRGASRALWHLLQTTTALPCIWAGNAVVAALVQHPNNAAVAADGHRVLRLLKAADVGGAALALEDALKLCDDNADVMRAAYDALRHLSASHANRVALVQNRITSRMASDLSRTVNSSAAAAIVGAMHQLSMVATARLPDTSDSRRAVRYVMAAHPDSAEVQLWCDDLLTLMK